MLADLIEKSKLRSDYEYNSLRPQLDPVISKLKAFEATADKDYFEAFSELDAKKGTILLREGEISNKFYFMKEGLARLFLHTDNQEITVDFFFASEFIDSYDSSAIKIPSQVNIELLMDSSLYVANWDTLRGLKFKYPILAEIERMIVAFYLRAFQKRIIGFQSLSASERYDQLINLHPYMIHQVPVSQIASFLGVTIETLSRIRGKIKPS